MTDVIGDNTASRRTALASVWQAAWFALCLAGLAGAAVMFRYEPMAGQAVWDRWLWRACLVGVGTEKRYCSPADLPQR